MREGWKQIKLGDIIHIKHGYGFKGEYFVEEPNNNILVTPGNFAIGGGFKDDKMKYYDGPINEEFVLSEGDVIVTMTDLSKQADTLGYSAKVPKDDINTYLHNQRIGLVSLLSKDYDLDFIYWLLRTHAYQRYIAGSSSGATVKHTSPKKIYSTKLTIPKSKQTQRKIASILSAYDDLIENNLKRIKLLEEQAQLTYEEWFVRFKFPGHETTKFDEDTGLPEGWEKGKIEDYFKTSSGGTPSRKKIKEYYTNGNINWVKTKELLGSFIFDTEEKITEKGLNNSSAKLFPANTILIGMYGGVHGEGRKSTLGQLGIITKPSTSNQACCAFLKKEGINYSVPYLFYYLKSKQKQLLNISMGAAQQNISQSMIKKFPFILPNKDVYDRFDEQVSLLFSSIIVLHKQNQLLKEARDILLPRLMSGMINLEKLDVGSLKYEVNDSLGMVAEDSKKHDKA